MLLFNEPKFKDTLINDVLIAKIGGKLLSYDSRNQLKISGQRYQMRLKAEKNIDEFVSKIDFLNI
jgi:hypothetical protein